MKNKKILIVDYGLGNLLSLKRAFEYLGSEVIISNVASSLNEASKIILPGVGAYAKAMESIRQLNLEKPLISASNKGIPLLGICLGMQLLLGESEEFGKTKGLNIIPGKVKSIKKLIATNNKTKVPHIGWNTLHKSDSSKNFNLKIFKNIKSEQSFYFVHSFASFPKNQKHRIYDTRYGDVSVPAIIGDQNIFGFQFHPEKSGQQGLKLLKEFLKI